MWHNLFAVSSPSPWDARFRNPLPTSQTPAPVTSTTPQRGSATSGPTSCGLEVPKTWREPLPWVHTEFEQKRVSDERSWMWSLAGSFAAELPGHPPRNVIFRTLTLFVQRYLLRFPLFPVARLLSFSNTLQGVDWLHIWWRRYYPWMMPKGIVSEELVQRGLGARGG